MHLFCASSYGTPYDDISDAFTQPKIGVYGLWDIPDGKCSWSWLLAPWRQSSESGPGFLPTYLPVFLSLVVFSWTASSHLCHLLPFDLMSCTLGDWCWFDCRRPSTVGVVSIFSPSSLSCCTCNCFLGIADPNIRAHPYLDLVRSMEALVQEDASPSPNKTRRTGITPTPRNYTALLFEAFQIPSLVNGTFAARRAGEVAVLCEVIRLQIK